MSIVKARKAITLGCVERPLTQAFGKGRSTAVTTIQSSIEGIHFVKGAWKKYSQAHLMTGGDESIFYATHFSNYIRTAVAMPLKAMSAT